MDPYTSPGFASLPSLSPAVDDNHGEFLPDPDEGLVLFPEDDQEQAPSQFHAGIAKKHPPSVAEEEEYMLGTVIVRVVAARGLVNPNSRGGVFRNSSAAVNPYASVKFGKTTQRTSDLYSTVNPVWPRDEVFFMDVSLPVSQLTHSPESSTSEEAASSLPKNDNSDNSAALLEDPYSNYEKPENTMLTVAIFHNETGNTKRKQKVADEKGVSGDSDDAFLGMASIDLTRLFTGKVAELDEWLPLTGTSTNNEDRRNSDYQSSMKEGRRAAAVRIVCEYEVSDVPPNPGDVCRFTRFCHPQDLYPLEPARPYKVEQAPNNGDIVHLMYESKEGWVLSFQAHKNMLICEERHVSALDTAQTELQTIGERLSVSPLVTTVTKELQKVADEGVVGLAQGIVSGSAFLFDRWFKGGVDTVIQDLQDVTNLDGRHSADTEQHLDLVSPTSSSASLEEEKEEEDLGALSIEDSFPDEDAEALPNMPACPITGFPMVNPVVAADGFTYERSAMARWLKTSNKSPMTGQILIHKELVPNYGLVSSIQEVAAREEQLKSDPNL
eukprot:CAMPEP_0116077856 /NCGR_PEP_ID=MMETSP0327-20121206/287_1 /TAXON_ID=44447 /ORGANISM="Pseudo-nitzschia delicatissima, Strain B596" /LENGTH=552 /DNA_ID=CAMNT_0003568353 /DNA_START=228 /DNA_END=1886 /DNA_ORIENTATION=+